MGKEAWCCEQKSIGCLNDFETIEQPGWKEVLQSCLSNTDDGAACIEKAEKKKNQADSDGQSKPNNEDDTKKEDAMEDLNDAERQRLESLSQKEREAEMRKKKEKAAAEKKAEEAAKKLEAKILEREMQRMMQEKKRQKEEKALEQILSEMVGPSGLNATEAEKKLTQLLNASLMNAKELQSMKDARDFDECMNKTGTTEEEEIGRRREANRL